MATGFVCPCNVPVGQGTAAPIPAPGAWAGNRWEVVPEPSGGPEPAVMDLPPRVAVTYKPPHRGCWRGAGLGTVELLEGVFHGASSFLLPRQRQRLPLRCELRWSDGTPECGSSGELRTSWTQGLLGWSFEEKAKGRTAKRTRGEQRALGVPSSSEGATEEELKALGRNCSTVFSRCLPAVLAFPTCSSPALKTPWELLKILLFCWDFQEYVDPALCGVDI